MLQQIRYNFQVLNYQFLIKPGYLSAIILLKKHNWIQNIKSISAMNKNQEARMALLFQSGEQIIKISNKQAYFRVRQRQSELFFKRVNISEIQEVSKFQGKLMHQQMAQILKNQLKLSKSNISLSILAYDSLLIRDRYAYFTHKPFGNILSFQMKQNNSYHTKICLLLSLALALQDLHKKQYCIATLNPSTIFIQDFHGDEYQIIFSEVRSMRKLGTKNAINNEIKGKTVSLYLEKSVYIAPEIWKQDYYTLSADIWSLGVIFYQFLFSHQWNSSKKFENQICFPQATPPWIKMMLKKMMSHQPSDRYQIKDVVMILKNSKLSAQSTSKFYKCEWN